MEALVDAMKSDIEEGNSCNALLDKFNGLEQVPEQATRERQINDPNRYPPGYELVDTNKEPETEYGNIGKCEPN